MPSSPDRVVRKRLADGTVKEYRYKRGQIQRTKPPEHSMAALLIAYRRSPEYRALKPVTAQHYGYRIRDLEAYGDRPIETIDRKSLLHTRDAIAVSRGPAAANVFMRVTATIFAWARERGWVTHSPADRIRQLPGGHLLAWTRAEADAAEAKMLPHLARVVILGRYTGQRRSDLIAMMWSAYDGSTIRVKQQKGGAGLIIPVHPRLKAALDEWKREATSTHLLTGERGAPWKPNNLTWAMHEAVRTIPEMRDGLNVHGLRKLAATTLADAGCSTHEIAAITGHKTLAMVSLYTASADQERLAAAAIARLDKPATVVSIPVAERPETGRTTG